MIRLRYLGHNLEVPEGQFVIGRSSKCQLSVDDPLISRQHAVLIVAGGSATVEDLGSRNGVLVNGEKVSGAHTLVDGDTITVGSQVMTIHGLASGSARPRRPEMQTLQTANLFELSDDPTLETGIRPLKPEGDPDRRVNELSLIGVVAEKAMAMGKLDDAERLLERPLKDVLARVKKGGPKVDPAVAQRAAGLGVKLGAAKQGAAWIDYAIDLYLALGELLPQPIVDELYTVLRKTPCDAELLHAYVESLRAVADTLGANERFLMSRIEGLEPLVGLK
ncbi:MAG: FHA domain-containing protein [Polyangiaceae bacterium]|nr:FHA domain-containing protein [Polyangiaceae bacterium]